MAEVTNDLLLEVLKSIQARMVNHEDGLRDIRNRMGAMQTQLVGIEQHIGNIYETIGALDTRVARIEKRLDMIDEPAE